ncbi:MAG TPA: hypothetical protein VMM60_02735, partial [Ilumatobacter sp.]|nr:hypothetical protein [Ilumatobacter sp.]
MNGLKRPVAATCIGAFAVAALLGIVALLGGGDFGETEVDILLTTVIVGITCIAVLCALTTTGTKWETIGLFGSLSAFVGAALALAATWGDFSGDAIYRALGVACTLAGACAWASLVLVASSARTAVSRAAGQLTATGLVIGAAMIIVPILTLPDWS